MADGAFHGVARGLVSGPEIKSSQVGAHMNVASVLWRSFSSSCSLRLWRSNFSFCSEVPATAIHLLHFDGLFSIPRTCSCFIQ